MALEVTDNLFSSEKKRQYAGVWKNDRRLLSDSESLHWDSVQTQRKEERMIQFEELVSIHFNPNDEVHRFTFNIAEGPENHRRFFRLDIAKEFKSTEIATQISKSATQIWKSFFGEETAEDTDITFPVEITASPAGWVVFQGTNRRTVVTDPNPKQIELTMGIVAGTDGESEWLKISWNPEEFRLKDNICNCLKLLLAF